EPVTINGDGAQRRDFVYVADVVAHLLAAMRRLEEARAPRHRLEQRLERRRASGADVEGV
ncbi:MAG: NAD-dependent epimerase/dehydratase family protein, partial [Alphaproteobacteria bacterium]